MKKTNFKLFTILVLCLGVALNSCKKDKDAEAETINLGSGKAAGEDAHSLLSGGTYSSLALEIHYMPGYKPDDASVNNLKSFLSTFVNKSDGITVTYKETASQGGSAMTGQQVADLETKDRTAASTSGKVITVYLLFTDCDYAGNQGNSKILGVAYKSTSIAVFGRTISANSGGSGQMTKVTLESTVLEHEFGHLLGLVNNGSVMQTKHADSSHGTHCANSSCLMYFQTESTTGIAARVSAGIPDLDDNCKADLTGNGGK